MKKLNWNKIGWRTLQVLIILIMNGATIAYIVLNLCDVRVPNNLSMINNGEDMFMSYYQLITNGISFKVPGGFEYTYEWYHKFLIYFFMIIGYVGTYGLSKLLYHNHKEKQKEEVAERRHKEVLQATRDKKTEKKIEAVWKD